MKVCKSCKALKELSEFAKCKRSKLGRKSRCKICVNSMQQLRRHCPEQYASLLKSNKIVSKAKALEQMNTATKSRAHRVNQETFMIRELVESHKLGGMELAIWQDSTKSDFGDRPIGCNVDLWLPAQVKTTNRTSDVLHFQGAAGYDCDVVCIGPTGSIYVFDTDFIQANKDSLQGGQVISIASRPSRTSSVFSSVAPIDRFRFADVRRMKWNEEYQKHLRGEECGLFPEYHLRMQAPVCCQMEVFTMTCFRYLNPRCVFEWSGPSSSIDAVVDGLGVQFKTAGWNKRLRNCTFIGQCHKKVGRTTMSYEVGEVDRFVFITIHAQLRLYFEWNIPSEVMDKELEVLARRTDGKFTYEGKQSITLSLLGPNDENIDLQQKVFGKMPRNHVDRRTSAFLKVVELPEEVIIPECMKNRDPVCAQGIVF